MDVIQEAPVCCGKAVGVFEYRTKPVVGSGTEGKPAGVPARPGGVMVPNTGPGWGVHAPKLS